MNQDRGQEGGHLPGPAAHTLTPQPLALLQGYRRPWRRWGDCDKIRSMTLARSAWLPSFRATQNVEPWLHRVKLEEGRACVHTQDPAQLAPPALLARCARQTEEPTYWW
jgi:hypothetical protein